MAILVKTGFGDRPVAGDCQRHTTPGYIAPDLAAAVESILQRSSP